MLVVLAVQWVHGLIKDMRKLTLQKVLEKLFRMATWIPMVASHINSESAKTIKQFTDKYSNLRKGKVLLRLPEAGFSENYIVEQVTQMTNATRKNYTDGGHLSGGIFSADDDHWNFIAETMRLSIVANPLFIDEFIYVSRMEAEIIRWTLELYHGDKNACGIVTSGGTESILLCVLAYREQAKQERGVTEPNIVMSETAHAAFDKACFYFGVELRKVPLTADHQCNYNALKRRIDKNTICLVASAPEYAFGTYDPIEKIAALAQSWGIGCHSDCCLGGYINPFIKRNGFGTDQLPLYDFRVPGVTSISCDPHKYALGPKGCSLAMFRDKKLREYQLFVTTSWNGGIYATTCMAGSRPGNIIVGNWASLMKIGRKG
jgi:sphinganine-1-phosphate aldolase